MNKITCLAIVVFVAGRVCDCFTDEAGKSFNPLTTTYETTAFVIVPEAFSGSGSGSESTTESETATDRANADLEEKLKTFETATIALSVVCGLQVCGLVGCGVMIYRLQRHRHFGQSTVGNVYDAQLEQSGLKEAYVTTSENQQGGENQANSFDESEASDRHRDQHDREQEED